MSTPRPRKYGPSIRDPESVFQRESRSLADTYNSLPLVNGIRLVGVTLGGNTTQVAHQLSRPYQGFLVIDQTAGGFVWRDASVTDLPDRYIPLKASSNMTVSLWVY